MATKTQAEMATLVLEHLGVKAAGQNASAEDQVKAEEALASVHSQLRYAGKAPFALATVPEWAWFPLAHYVAGKIVGDFGLQGEALARTMAEATDGYRALCEQTAGKHDPSLKTRIRYY